MNTVMQQKAIDSIKFGKNVFVTGGGGVGKSWVIQQVSDYGTVVVAPTGIAALNIKGSTCHSFFGLPFGMVEFKDRFSFPSKSRRLIQQGTVKRIIIDEIGMMRADYLDLIDIKLKNITGKTNKPFGGIQVVVVGDFFQLEPIVADDELEYFLETYENPFAFSAECWNFDTVELTEVKRQSDTEQIELLNSVRRDDEYSEESLVRIQEIAKEYVNCPDTLHLCNFNKDSVEINKYWFNQIEGNVGSYVAEVGDKWGSINTYPVPKNVRVKVGSKVLICANNPSRGYVNGDRGTVIGFNDKWVEVELQDKTVKVEHHLWEKVSYSKVGDKVVKNTTSSFYQMPLKMGWAVTVHKSQGMTLDSAAIHVGRGCFSHGQLYVALSRVKDLSNLSFVKPLSIDNLIVRQEVKQFYESIGS